MSDYSQGPGWWQASDGKWYPPQNPAPATAAPYSAPAGGYAYTTAPKTNPLAIGSLVCSLVSCGIGSIAAIVLGHMAKKQIRESGGTQTGDGLATAGLVLGYIGVVLGIGFLIFYIVVLATSEDLNNDFNNDFGMAVFGLLTGR